MKRTCGFEIELIAPRGSSRRDLAQAMAGAVGGTVEDTFYPQAEPNPAADAKPFETLTLAFRVLDRGGQLLCTIADDLTLRDDLDKSAEPKPGWYRILCDDIRLERLIARHTAAADPIERVLQPLAPLFGGTVRKLQEGYYRLSDSEGTVICMAALQPGERERAAEIITSPLSRDHRASLDSLLAPARALGFLLPSEGAVHIHFDGAAFLSASRMQRLVTVFAERRQELRALCRPNPRCRRLGPWPPALIETVNAPGFAALPWKEAVKRMNATGIKKYCDFNIVNLLDERRNKLTFEVRILPPTLNAGDILGPAAVFEQILDEICATSSGPV
jgi:hypothetical protein